MFRIKSSGRAEGLERWSARATLAILSGITIEIGILMWFPHLHFWETVATASANILIGSGLAAEYVVIVRLSAVKRRASEEFMKRLAEVEASATEANLRAIATQLALQALRQSRESADPPLQQFIRIHSEDRRDVVREAPVARSDGLTEAARQMSRGP